MSSKRDLVEAHSFNRRRLVTAFVSGAPGGREVEPVRYGRTLIGGLVLAGLIVAGAAVSGLLKPTIPSDWDKDGLVIGKSSGSRFVAYNHTLYPVINTTSARLILATDGDLSITTIPDDKIAAEKQGATIGIPGAPDILPSPSHLRGTGWTACTNDAGGIRTTISSTPQATADPSGALLVRSGGTVYVVSGEHRYAVPSGDTRDATLRALGLYDEAIKPVSGQWLDLVTPGSPLVPFTVPDQGRSLDTGVPGLTKVGTPVVVDGVPFVLGPDKNLVKLDDFSFAMYLSSGPGLKYGKLVKSAADVARLPAERDPSKQLAPGDWPESNVRPYSAPSSPCLLLDAAVGQPAHAELAVARSQSALSTGSTTTRSVDSGSGALVRGSSGGVLGSGTPYLIDSTGTRFALGAKGNEKPALTALGYAKVTPVPVPRPWLELFGDGPQLSASAVSAAGQ